MCIWSGSGAIYREGTDLTLQNFTGNENKHEDLPHKLRTRFKLEYERTVCREYTLLTLHLHILPHKLSGESWLDPCWSYSTVSGTCMFCFLFCFSVASSSSSGSVRTRVVVALHRPHSWWTILETNILLLLDNSDFINIHL